ncbi:MAG: mechanosensitive ion channel family protein, partial [Hominimerdicola sp.]
NEEGTVDAISILYTRLLTVDNKAIFIPNGVVAKSTIVNLTSEDKRHLQLKFSIAYNNDYRKAKSLIAQALESEELVSNEPEPPLIAMCEHGSSSIIILMRAWVPTDKYWEIRYRLLEKVKDLFDENNISIPFDQLDVHVKND